MFAFIYQFPYENNIIMCDPSVQQGFIWNAPIDSLYFDCVRKYFYKNSQKGFAIFIKLKNKGCCMSCGNISIHKIELFSLWFDLVFDGVPFHTELEAIC